MQVTIDYVKFKNLLSYGNTYTTVWLSKHKHTLITAKNAQGKSSLIEAIFYGLYGKPYRNIKVGQLVNSINKKNLEVEIGLTANGKCYKVIRGQKPNVFLIFEDGVIIQEDAAARDYQAYLETKILGINQRSFRQIVCIGSASYKPFMDLSASDRRAITEEVLDIAVFSTMQDVAKKYHAEHKSIVDSLSTEISLYKAQIASNKTMLDQLLLDKKNRESTSAIRKEELEGCLSTYTNEYNAIEDELQQLDSLSIRQKHAKILSAMSSIEVKMLNVSDKIATCAHSLDSVSDTCPTCHQQLPEDTQKATIQELQEKHTSYQETRASLVTLKNDTVAKLEIVQSSLSKCETLWERQRELSLLMDSVKNQLKQLTSEDKSTTIQLCKDTLTTLADKVIDKTNEKNEYSKKMLYYKTSIDLLKDDGVKSKIISTFIPIMNQYINEYLTMFDMFIKFELDEFFNEKILSRGRDTFTYNSFSQGEKQKIDIAILMAWRKIAMSRSSVACNVLIFDETMDSSLDSESIDIFVDVLGGLGDSVNSLVVSHRATVVPEIFDRHITVSKVRDFSILTEQ